MHISNNKHSLLKTWYKKQREDYFKKRNKEKIRLDVVSPRSSTKKTVITTLPLVHQVNIMAWINEPCMTVEACLGLVEPPHHGKEFIPTKWPFEFGKALVVVRLDILVRKISTKMYEFHDWCIKVSAKGDTMFLLLGKPIDYFGHSEQLLWLEFKDVYKVYNQDAPDVSLDVLDHYCFSSCFPTNFVFPLM